MKQGREKVEVWLDASFMSAAEKVGDLYHNRGQIFFEYANEWLSSKTGFNIDPELLFHTGEQISLSTFGIFTDSTPDRWGRKLMDKRESVDSKLENRPIRNLYEWDYLLGVQDITRMGALRLRRDGEFLDNRNLSAPPITSLEELQHISKLLENEDIENLPQEQKWLSIILEPGASLGGARPKANFLNSDGSLWIAKFPKEDDKEDVGLWEGITLELAKLSGINVPDYSLMRFGKNHHTFTVKRFDRDGDKREIFVSAMTMLQKKDGESGSYMEIAEFIHNNGAERNIQADMNELWKRMVFNVMTSNRDDHLRNHGFIRNKEEWRLSPAYDINPNKYKSEHSISLNFISAEPTIEVLFGALEFLRIDYNDAVKEVKKIHAALSNWRNVAQRIGATNSQINKMSPAFTLVDNALTFPDSPKLKNGIKKSK